MNSRVIGQQRLLLATLVASSPHPLERRPRRGALQQHRQVIYAGERFAFRAPAVLNFKHKLCKTYEKIPRKRRPQFYEKGQPIPIVPPSD